MSRRRPTDKQRADAAARARRYRAKKKRDVVEHRIAIDEIRLTLWLERRGLLPVRLADDREAQRRALEAALADLLAADDEESQRHA